MSVHLRANNSDNTHKMLSVHQRASDTVQFNTMCLYKKILSIEQKPGLPVCHKILVYKLNYEISKSKKHVFTQNMSINLIFNSNRLHIIITTCN